MRIFFIIILVTSLIGLSFVSRSKSAGQRSKMISVSNSYDPVVVLELFTSEGCSSCPPADELLPQLAKLDSNIIPLSFHVDYWNRLGWTDPFSSSEYAERQRKYVRQLDLESAYTPQLVVNGQYELVGSNRNEAEEAIQKGLQEKAKVRLTIDHVKVDNNKLSFTIHAEGDFKKTDLLAAWVQKQAIMHVKAGENSGATLSHINVVRTFSSQTTADKNVFEIEIPKNIPGNNLHAGWQLVVYTQQKNDLKITGSLLYQPDRNK